MPESAWTFVWNLGRSRKAPSPAPVGSSCSQAQLYETQTIPWSHWQWISAVTLLLTANNSELIPKNKKIRLYKSVWYSNLCFWRWRGGGLPLHDIWDVVSQTSYWTLALGGESPESWPLDHQGIPNQPLLLNEYDFKLAVVKLLGLSVSLHS